MKKSLLAIALFASAAASAGNLTGTAGYEYLNTAGDGAKNHESLGSVGLAYKTPYGVVDGAVLQSNVDTAQGTSSGVEFGYSYPVKVAAFTVTPRAFFGELSTVNDADSGRFGGVAVEAQYPLTPVLGGFASVDYRRGAYEHTIGLQKSYQFGVDYQFTKELSARVAYKHTNSGSVEIQNGVAVKVSYGF